MLFYFAAIDSSIPVDWGLKIPAETQKPYCTQTPDLQIETERRKTEQRGRFKRPESYPALVFFPYHQNGVHALEASNSPNGRDFEPRLQIQGCLLLQAVAKNKISAKHIW
jgi:hypothetical protein